MEGLRESAERLGLAGTHVLVACSGGVDSVVLAHGLARLRAALDLRLSLGHVHHGLRADAADLDAAFVERLGEKLGVPAEVVRVKPLDSREGHPSRTRPTVQEAARRARYDALAALCGRLGADFVATAHHLDDQAETVLMRLLRGTGPEGLGGIREVSRDGRIVRPLLGVPRAEILRHAREEGLDWREDESNLDTGYTRNRLRRDWLPGLARAFNPRLLRAVGDLAEALRRDGEWIAEVVGDEWDRIAVPEADALRIDPAPWGEYPEGLARRLAAQLLRDAGLGRDTNRTHVLRCAAFLRTARTGTRIELPGSWELRRDRDAFRLARVEVQPRGSC